MDNKDFDKYIKDSLESIDSKTPPNDWDSFSQLLHQEEGFENLDVEDEAFDTEVSKKMQNHRKGFNSFHWVLLKNRLEKEALLRKQVYTTKIMESVLVLLLVFTFINLDNYYNITPNVKVSPQEYAMIQVLKYPEFSGLENMKPNSTLKTEKVPIRDFHTQQQVNNLHSVQSDNATTVSQIPVLSIRHVPLNIIKLNVLDYFGLSKNVLKSLDTEIKEIEPSNDPPMANAQEYRANIKSVKFLKPSREEVKFDLKEAYPMFYIKPKEVEKKEIFITSTVGTSIGVINSPGDALVDLSPYNIYNVDFTTGIEISTLHKNFEFGIGLNYQSVYYTPAKVTEITGGFTDPILSNTLDKIEFDLFQIPINFRYHVNPNAKTHFYAGVGIGMNLAGFTSYKVTTEEIAPSSAPFEEDRNYTYGRSNLEQKNFHPGALENGSLFDNFYLSASAEVGIERKIDENFALTASVGYSKSLSYLGIGPNNDIIDAVKLGIGMKYRI